MRATLKIDQMTAHRAQVQPDRYVVTIDVQQQSPTEQMRTVQRWRQALRSKAQTQEQVRTVGKKL